MGFDDGVVVTGNTITAEVSILDSDISIGDTYDHRVEEDGKRISSSGKASDGPFDMVNYPDVERGNQFAFGRLVIDSSGDVLISVSKSVHLGFGGHVSLSYNITEFAERLLD